MYSYEERIRAVKLYLQLETRFTATVRQLGYPTRASSVCGLVARGVAAALNQGREALPARPAKPEVTVHTNDVGYCYVRLDEIPEPARTLLDQMLAGLGHS